MIRELRREDFDGLMSLYMQLHNNIVPEQTEEIMGTGRMPLLKMS